MTFTRVTYKLRSSSYSSSMSRWNTEIFQQFMQQWEQREILLWAVLLKDKFMNSTLFKALLKTVNAR